MKIRNNISLQPFNTFGINVIARQLLEVSTREELQEALAFNQNIVSSCPVILGGGSNILLLGNINLPVIRIAIEGIVQIAEDEDFVFVKAGAGVNWHSFVLYCLDMNLAGIENLALIPGTVGASPMQNIGAYGVELKDCFHSLTAVSVSDGEEVRFNKEACEFGYRTSVFKTRYKDQFVISDVTFRLNKHPVFNTSYGAISAELEKMDVSGLSIRVIAQAVMNIRKSKLPDPSVVGNAGSFFKNPEVPAEKYFSLKEAHPGIVAYDLYNGRFKLAAGWLIEQCGWKGYRKADAGCHQLQALVLVNYGKATGKEIFELAEEIIRSVLSKFDVQLEMEVNIIR